MSERARLAAAVILLAGYFGILVIPEWFSGVQGLPLFLYLLSLPLVLAGLALLGLWGGVGWLRSRRLGPPADRRHARRFLISCAGVLLFISFWQLSAAIRGALPTGSHRLEFDTAVWLDSGSAAFVKGDITPRQKMLGDLVTNVLPGRSRREVESLLGPSLQNSYFKETGRDLIYVMGPQRDSLFAIDSEWLLIWFDASGKLERWEIRTD